MPGPSFFTPKSVRPSLPRKRFTAAQANKALPLVSRIVGDIVHMHDHALELQTRLESLNDAKLQAPIQSELNATMDRLQDLVHELSSVGCELKDYQTGLVDFIGRHQGRDVYLCWRLGEEKVAFWHELNGGFAARKPIALLDEA